MEDPVTSRAFRLRSATPSLCTEPGKHLEASIRTALESSRMTVLALESGQCGFIVVSVYCQVCESPRVIEPAKLTEQNRGFKGVTGEGISNNEEVAC